jgi:hypothetical protein
MCNQVGICALLVLVQGIDDNELKVRGGGGGGGRLSVRHEETNEQIVEEDKAIGQRNGLLGRSTASGRTRTHVISG